MISRTTRVFLMAMALVSSVYPAAADRSRLVSCKLVVDGQEFIAGTCRFSPLGRDGSFQIMSGNGQYFAQVNVEARGQGYGYWNGEPYARHAHSNLGPLVQEQACWVNERASVCAW